MPPRCCTPKPPLPLPPADAPVRCCCCCWLYGCRCWWEPPALPGLFGSLALTGLEKEMSSFPMPGCSVMSRAR
jgi:hypothetical protein